MSEKVFQKIYSKHLHKYRNNDNYVNVYFIVLDVFLFITSYKLPI
jgi:hypothetical protein